MHLRRLRIRTGTVALPGGGGEEPPSLLAPSILCPAQRWHPWAHFCWKTQSPSGGGAEGAEGVRSPRVIANSKEGAGGRAGGGGGEVRTLWGVGLSKLLSLQKNKFIENFRAHPQWPAFPASHLVHLGERAEDPAGHPVPELGAQDPDSLVSDSGAKGSGRGASRGSQRPSPKPGGGGGAGLRSPGLVREEGHGHSSPKKVEGCRGS